MPAPQLWTHVRRFALASPDGESPLLADLDLRLDECPIDLLPQLENRQIHGKLSGSVQLAGLGGRPAQAVTSVGKRERPVARPLTQP